MPDVKPTPARVQLMRDIASPDVEVYASISGFRGSWSTADAFVRHPGERERKVTGQVQTLANAGLVSRGPVGVRFHQPRHYSLTDAGRAWLAEHDKEH